MSNKHFILRQKRKEVPNMRKSSKVALGNGGASPKVAFRRRGLLWRIYKMRMYYLLLLPFLAFIIVFNYFFI